MELYVFRLLFPVACFFFFFFFFSATALQSLEAALAKIDLNRSLLGAAQRSIVQRINGSDYKTDDFKADLRKIEVCRERGVRDSFRLRKKGGVGDHV